MNIQGNVIREEDLRSQEYPVSIDLCGIPAGIYFLHIIGDDVIINKKILKQ
jgi:hypothetical protein